MPRTIRQKHLILTDQNMLNPALKAKGLSAVLSAGFWRVKDPLVLPYLHRCPVRFRSKPTNAPERAEPQSLRCPQQCEADQVASPSASRFADQPAHAPESTPARTGPLRRTTCQRRQQAQRIVTSLVFLAPYTAHLPFEQSWAFKSDGFQSSLVVLAGISSRHI